MLYTLNRGVNTCIAGVNTFDQGQRPWSNVIDHDRSRSTSIVNDRDRSRSLSMLRIDSMQCIDSMRSIAFDAKHRCFASMRSIRCDASHRIVLKILNVFEKYLQIYFWNSSQNIHETGAKRLFCQSFDLNFKNKFAYIIQKWTFFKLFSTKYFLKFQHKIKFKKRASRAF